MKILTPICPNCGGKAVGTLETLDAIAELSDIREDGTCEYTGLTKHLEETQRTVHIMDKATLVCSQHHIWTSTIHNA